MLQGEERSKSRISTRYVWWVPALIVVVLFPVSLYNQMLFHTLVELSAVGVAIACFVVACNTYSFSKNNYLCFLGVGFLGVGIFDLFHALSFNDLPFFTSNTVGFELPFWFLARCLEALILLVAPFVITRKIRVGRLFSIYAVIVVLATWAVIDGKLSFLQSAGTDALLGGVNSGFVIVGMLLGALVVQWYKRDNIDNKVFVLVAVAIILAVLVELAVTLSLLLSEHSQGYLASLGHFLKLFSFWAIYVALLESSLKQPFWHLFKEVSVLAERKKQHKQHLSDVENRLAQLFQAVEQVESAVAIANAAGEIEYVNWAFTTLTGYSFEDVVKSGPGMVDAENAPVRISADVKESLLAGKKWTGISESRKKDGSYYWATQSVTPLKNDIDEITHFVSISEDQTPLHDAQETIKQLAFYDSLTELPNRRLMADRLQQAVERVQRYPEQMVAVMIFNLDNFKNVNDMYGHLYGDLLLQKIAKIFQARVRKEDTVSRVGGDEFAIILSGVQSIERIADVASGIVEVLAKPIALQENQVVIGTSIGISVCPKDTIDANVLFDNANTAMYCAKEKGKNNFQFYHEDMNLRIHERLVLEGKLRHAIEKEHFALYYQPQIDLATNEIIGMEALIRWIDPAQGIISPATFIPLAEATGMIGKIGDWVIRKACEETRWLQSQNFPQVKVAVNVSAYQFRQGDHLCNVVSEALKDTGLEPKFLAIELTESVLINNVEETIEVLLKLKALGITLAIDDFGTGYSSLSYLKKFPIDTLKIDQSFIRDILEGVNDAAIVNAIISMAHSLGLSVLAEGVETGAHNDFLTDHKCDYAQGYLYCRPKPARELLEFWESGELNKKL
ncbi:MAG: hypothetical protein COA99_06910 [Moraxellaceae bacterium]|nr:MAG: hypothetical protein COA99_06910 [Moraxellaceae bacterium]